MTVRPGLDTRSADPSREAALPISDDQEFVALTTVRQRSRWSRTVLAALLAVGVVGSCSSPAAAPSSLSPSPSDPSSSVPSLTPSEPPGSQATGELSQLFEIDGREIYLQCRGSGSPTIVLQSGYGNAADIWNAAAGSPPAVFEGTAGLSRVCAYDRPGSLRQFDDIGAELPGITVGRSDTAPMPRTGRAVVTELHDLLAAAGVPGPYVLVGHSLGGLFNLLYAQTNPDQVAGMVFIDATYPDLESLLDPAVWNSFSSPLASPTSPIAGYDMEGYDLDGLMTEIAAAPGVPSVPAVFLFADRAETGDSAFDSAYAAVLPELREQFVARFPGATSSVIPDTTHYIQVERPDAVIQAIAGLLAR